MSQSKEEVIESNKSIENLTNAVTHTVDSKCEIMESTPEVGVAQSSEDSHLVDEAATKHQTTETTTTTDITIEETSYKDNLSAVINKMDSVQKQTENIEQEYTITYVNEEEIVSNADSLVEKDIIEQYDEVFEIHTVPNETEETYESVIEVQGESEANQANDVSDAVFISEDQLVEGESEVIIDEACIQEQIVCETDNVPSAVTDEDQFKVPIKETVSNEQSAEKEKSVEDITNADDNNKLEEQIDIKEEVEGETIEEQLEKITMCDSIEAERPTIIEPRRSRRKMNQKINEKQVINNAESTSIALNENKIDDGLEEIKVKVEEIQIDSVI